jgi:hypothetical protein
MYLSLVFGQLMTILAIAAGAIYAGMVLMSYHTDGPHYRLSFELRDPVRSVQHLAVWLGVKVFDACLRVAKAVFNLLLEASAEVGEWFMRRNPTVQQIMRSRFLV